MKHGRIKSYNNGCRCEACKSAQSEYRKQRRADTAFPHLLVRHDWYDQALCRTERHDVDLFFVDRHGPGHSAAAVAVCRRCPVRQECLDYALTYRERYGVWGGKTASQRKRIIEKWHKERVA